MTTDYFLPGGTSQLYNHLLGENLLKLNVCKKAELYCQSIFQNYANNVKTQLKFNSNYCWHWNEDTHWYKKILLLNFNL